MERELSFVHSLPLNIIIAIVGWIYFAAWSISFYPQVNLSVFGLIQLYCPFSLLDYPQLPQTQCGRSQLWLPGSEHHWFPQLRCVQRGPLLDHPSTGERECKELYVLFICCSQQDYFLLHPAGVNPVQINDVVFALHAVAATLFTIFQCLIFEVRITTLCTFTYPAGQTSCIICTHKSHYIVLPVVSRKSQLANLYI